MVITNPSSNPMWACTQDELRGDYVCTALTESAGVLNMNLVWKGTAHSAVSQGGSIPRFSHGFWTSWPTLCDRFCSFLFYLSV